jgi:NADPH:quinone reductase
VNGLTAWRGLADLKLAGGETLVVTGASGSVGGFALELAVGRGFRVVGVVRDDQQRHDALELGATAGVSTGDADPGKAVREIVPGGADALLDTASIAGPALAAIPDGGKYVTVTALPLLSAQSTCSAQAAAWTVRRSARWPTWPVRAGSTPR